MTVSGGSDVAVVQVPPRILARKTDGATPYSKQYSDPFPRKQSKHERITPLLGCLNPQSGKIRQDDGRIEFCVSEDVSAPTIKFRSGLK